MRADGERPGAAELFGEDVDAKTGGHGDLVRVGHADGHEHQGRDSSPPDDAGYRSAKPDAAASIARGALTSPAVRDDSSGHAAGRSSAPPRRGATGTGLPDTPAGAARVASPGRRSVLTSALGVGAGLPLARLVAAQDDAARRARPQPEDRFAHAAGERKGRVVTLADLPPGGPPLTAYPM